MAKGDQATTTQSSQPWGESQPYLKDVMSGAKTAYQSGQGFQYYPENTVVPFASQTTQALNQAEGIANQGNPLAGAAKNQALGVLNTGGISDWQRGALNKTYDIATGNSGINTEGDYRGVLSKLEPYASGANVNGGSPEFLAALDYQAGRTADDVNRAFSNSGRYGSEAHRTGATEAVGNLRNSAIAGEIARQQGMQMNAAGQQAGILNAITQGQGANLANQVGAGQNIFSAGDAGASQAARYAALGGDIYGQQFLPSQQLSNIGATNQSRDQALLQDEINRFNAAQSDPWKRLNAYSALVGGTGQLGGTTTQTATTPTNYLAPIGGALGGAQIGSMFGPIGTGVGALGGGLLGLLGL